MTLKQWCHCTVWLKCKYTCHYFLLFCIRLQVIAFKNKEAYQPPSLPYPLRPSYLKQITVNGWILVRFLAESMYSASNLRRGLMCTGYQKVYWKSLFIILPFLCNQKREKKFGFATEISSSSSTENNICSFKKRVSGTSSATQRSTQQGKACLWLLWSFSFLNLNHLT